MNAKEGMEAKDDELSLETIDTSKFDRNDDLSDVVDAVNGLAGEWSKLACKLRLSDDDTKIVKRNNPENIEECLKDSIVLWLKESYNTARFGHPSWRTLVIAVKDMNKALAVEIANAHRVTALVPVHTHPGPPAPVVPLQQVKPAVPISGDQYPILRSSISTRELNTLKWKDPSGKDRVLKLKDEMSAEWFKIGSTVGFTDAKLKVIKTSHMNEGEGCMNEVIRLWIQKMPEEYPTTWEGLIKLLKEVEMNDSVVAIQQAAADPQSSLNTK